MVVGDGFAGGRAGVVAAEVARGGAGGEKAERGGRGEEGEAGVVDRRTEREVVVGDLQASARLGS